MKLLAKEREMYNNSRMRRINAMKNSFEQGQILLITLLVLTVATTIALSLIGRATIDLSMSNQLEESTRAFNAAEAGIEQALQSGSETATGPVTLTSGVTYEVSVNSIGGQPGVFQLARKTPKNVTETIWLVNHDPTTGALDETRVFDDNTLSLCWSQEEAPDVAAALEVTVLYKDNINEYHAARMAVDPDAVTRNNNFDSSGITLDGCGLGYYEKQVDFTTLGISPAGTDTLLALRIRPIYADATIAIDSASDIPQQGNVIESVGRTGTGVSRKVVVYQQYRAPLSVFDSVLFSQSSLSH